jgi:hypothetical protein
VCTQGIGMYSQQIDQKYRPGLDDWLVIDPLMAVQAFNPSLSSPPRHS